MARKDDRATEIGLIILRIGLGLILVYYGSQFTFGLFGGDGFQATLNEWQTRAGIPQWLGVFGVISTFAGGLGILLGLFTRVAAFGAACTMATAAYLNATSMNVAYSIANGRAVDVYLYPISLGVMALAIVFFGAGRYSLDKKFFGRGR